MKAPGLAPFLVAATAATLLAAGVRAAEQEPVLRAVAALQEPRLDGDVLGDPAWSPAPAATGFTQVRPFAGRAASQHTELRSLFTADALYFGIVLYDQSPQGIIVSDSRRDAPLDETDSVQLIIDPFRDGQNGWVFGTNPAGIQYDGQVSDEGRGGGGGGRFQGGSGGGFNLNWDGVWEVATAVGPDGWSVEMRIPFTTLRYPAVDDADGDAAQSWGLNVQRNIRRHNEVSYWAPLEQQFNLYRLSDAGSLVGLRPPPQKNLQVIPYALGQARRPPREGAADQTDSDLGVDVKYSLTAGLTLDLTVNTDFAQVEVDEQQINLDRFNLFFPEKRPFFLENAGFFSVGAPGEVELFFSRRIGIAADGSPIPIEWGGRLSGKAGRWNVGLLDMQTEGRRERVSPETGERLDAVPRSNFAVARLQRELRNRSDIGLLVVRREDSGSFARERNGTNDTYALDGTWGVGDYLTFSAFAAETDDDTAGGDPGRHHAFRVGADYASSKWSWSADTMEVGEDFDPEAGFLARSGFRRVSGFALRTVRPRDLLGFHELRPHVSYSGYWDFEGFQETGFLHLDNHWEWRNGYEIHTGVNWLREGVKERFEIHPDVFVEPGTTNDLEGQLVFNTNLGAPISLSGRVQIGGFFGGDRLLVSPTLRLRRGEKLTSEISWNHNDIDLPGGSFETNLGRLRVSYSFTPKLLLQALVQYNDRDDDVSTNLRLSWLRRANTGLFVVYNELEELGRRARSRPDRTLIVKISHVFDVLRR